MKIEPFKEINPPNEKGYWIDKKSGESFGGAYCSPVLEKNLKKLEAGFKRAMSDNSFLESLEQDNRFYLGLPTPVQYSKELTEVAGGEGKVGKIFLKRTDLTSGGSHKPINALASVKLAKYLGYKRIYTETGAAQNSRAVAAACAKENITCNEFDINVIQSDLFSNIQGTYDVIAFNPPYVPSLSAPQHENYPKVGHGGIEGTETIANFLGAVQQYLNPNGMVFLGINCFYVSETKFLELMISFDLQLKKIVRRTCNSSVVYVLCDSN